MHISDVFSFWKKATNSTVSTRSEHGTVGAIPMATIQVVAPESIVAVGTPRYPPMDMGIRVASADDVLASQADLIRLLKRNLGLSDLDFESKYLAPLRRAAELINLLPATRDKHHTGAGGLFRFATTMAVRSAQSADGRIFAASEGIERRRQTESAWRHAAFLTGLTCEMFRPLAEMIVVDEHGNQWSPYVAPLTTWAKAQGVDRYFIRWHVRDDVRSAANTLSSWAVNAVVGNDVLSELNRVKPAIVEEIFGVASGAITTADDSTLATLINEVRRRVIEKDHDIATTTYGRLTSGSHLEPYFLDAMRSLLRNGVWQVNTKGARCHYGSDGFFVAWRSGSTEILGHLKSEKISGVPTEHETLAEMMGRAGIISLAPDGSWIHLVRASSGSSAPMPAIRIQSPSAILGHLEVNPVSTALRVNSNTNKTVPAATVTTAIQSPSPANTQSQEPVAVKPTVDSETGEITVAALPNASQREATSSEDQLVNSPMTENVKAKAKAPQSPKPAPVQKSGIPSVPDSDDDVAMTFDKDLRRGSNPGNTLT